MKTSRYYLLLGALITIAQTNAARTWRPDVLGDKFKQTTITLADDYSGAIKATAIVYDTLKQSTKGVLYIHGFNDYFFQKEEAQAFSKAGYRFYALDLRKYGRSHTPTQHMGEVKNINEYYAEIDSCLAIMRSEGIKQITVVGHSTGGLIASNYAADHKEALPFEGMILNSPFLDWNFKPFKEAIITPFGAFLGGIFPNWKVNSGDNTFYGESVHKNYVGSWDYDLTWKPIETIPITFAWVRAIHRAQKKIQKTPNIPCPILVMHSDKSGYGNTWNDTFFVSDIVLDINDIEKYGKQLGPQATTATIPDGIHDLVLSRPEARKKTYDTMFGWLSENGL